MRDMSETPGPSTPPPPATIPPPGSTAPAPRPDPLYRTAAWVAIVAGVLFIALTILFIVCMFVCCH